MIKVVIEMKEQRTSLPVPWVLLEVLIVGSKSVLQTSNVRVRMHGCGLFILVLDEFLNELSKFFPQCLDCLLSLLAKQL